MILYTNHLIPKRFAAYTIGPLILIRPEYKDDKGLLEHEKVHVKQWWKMPIIHDILYFFCGDYRLDSEVEAYKEQLKYSPGNEHLFAEFIATKYGLDVTVDEALEMLK